jgi:alkylresorcinol/alkylpyrone synthase
MMNTLERATRTLQEKVGFDWKDIGVLVSTTITGVAVPSLDARLMNRLPIPHDVVRTPLFGIGCLGGVASLNRAKDLLKAYPNKLALVIAAEACSLTFQFSDVTMSNMVASSLFGDGTAAVLLAGKDHPLSRKGKLEIVDSLNTFYPQTERIMGWDMVDSGFKVVLSGNVPEIVQKHVGGNTQDFLERNHLSSDNINNLISHPGGPKVLNALSEVLKKDESLLRHSWESLRDQGNMSSVSVLNVLERSLDQNKLKKGYALALAMGPAFNSEMSLIRVED